MHLGMPLFNMEKLMLYTSAAYFVKGFKIMGVIQI